MDELTTLREVREGFCPRPLAPPAAVTERVLAVTRAGAPIPASSPRRRPGLLGRRPRSLRWVVPLAAAAAAVLAATGTLTLGGQREPQVPAAREVLLAAAAAAGSAPEVVPPPGSFVYSRSHGRIRGQFEREDGEKPTPLDSPYTEETWLAADGKRAGLTADTLDTPPEELPDMGGTRTSVHPAVCPGDVHDLCSGPGYVTTVPDDPSGALAFLRELRGMAGFGPTCAQYSGGCSPKTDEEVFSDGMTLLSQRWLPSRARGAVFEALSTLTGVRVVPEVTVAGRTGTGLAVSSTTEGGREDLLAVFDPATHLPVATRVAAVGSVTNHVYELVLEEPTLVGAAGVRPDGSRVDPRPAAVQATPKP